jgi:uncharacterized membrane protein YhaH (DUF805 family)
MNYTEFRGRASRAEFWWWYLFTSIIAILVSIADAVATQGVLSIIVFALVLLPSLALATRRLRAAGFHWALQFIALIPGGGIILIVLLCMPSEGDDSATRRRAQRKLDRGLTSERFL